MDYDLFVIGAGSAGVRAARMAAAMGKKVAVAESRYLGGTCVNVGCVPKKLFVYASEMAHVQQEAAGFGVNLTLDSFDWPTLRDNKTKEIERLNSIYRNLLDNSGATTIWGHAKLLSNNTVEVDGKTYTAGKILLATGGWPVLPDIPGKEHCIDSNNFFYMESFPKRALVIGSGYIATEFAGILNGLGADTCIASRSGKLLRGFDESTRQHAQQEIIKSGINLIKEQPKAIEKLASGSYSVSFENHDNIEVDCIISAAGRQPNLNNLGIENLNIQLTERGTIEVNDEFETSAKDIYAMGDLIDGPQLTPIALAEAMTFLRQQYQGDKTPLDYSNIPTAVFSQPNLSTVGLTEEQAIKQGIDIDVYESEFKALKHTLSGINHRSYMKLIVEKSSDKVVGIHMVGEHAGEILQGFAVAIKAGATKAVFDSTIGIHPSSAEEFVTMRSPRA